MSTPCHTASEQRRCGEQTDEVDKWNWSRTAHPEKKPGDREACPVHLLRSRWQAFAQPRPRTSPTARPIDIPDTEQRSRSSCALSTTPCPTVRSVGQVSSNVYPDELLRRRGAVPPTSATYGSWRAALSRTHDSVDRTIVLSRFAWRTERMRCRRYRARSSRRLSRATIRDGPHEIAAPVDTRNMTKSSFSRHGIFTRRLYAGGTRSAGRRSSVQRLPRCTQGRRDAVSSVRQFIEGVHGR